MIWRKSSYSSTNGSCVELATDGENVRLRDSKAPDGGTLTLSADTWRSLLDAAKAGELDGLL